MIAQSRFRSKVLWSAMALALLLWGWHYAYHNKMLSFNADKVTSDFTYNPHWDVHISESEKTRVNEILSQPFYYLGAGSQSYAFASADGKSVIKFFRMKHKVFHLKDVWAGDRSQERKDKLLAIFDAHKMAFEEMREDAGLIYLHLNKTHHINKKIKVVDRLRMSYEIDLDQVEFVLQDRAELIFDRFKKLMRMGNWQGLNAALSEMLHLINRRIEKGISDHDKAVKHNYGFVGDRAIQLDIGRIFHARQHKDYDKFLERIDKWFDEQSY